MRRRVGGDQVISSSTSEREMHLRLMSADLVQGNEPIATLCNFGRDFTFREAGSTFVGCQNVCVCPPKNHFSILFLSAHFLSLPACFLHEKWSPRLNPNPPNGLLISQRWPSVGVLVLTQQGRVLHPEAREGKPKPVEHMAGSKTLLLVLSQQGKVIQMSLKGRPDTLTRVKLANYPGLRSYPNLRGARHPQRHLQTLQVILKLLHRLQARRLLCSMIKT